MTPDDAEVALTSFEGKEHQAIKMAAAEILKDLGWDENLALRDEGDLQATDQAQRARLLYVIGTLRTLAVLAAAPPDFESALKQATLAMTYIKHAESTGLKALQFGRTQADDELAREVGNMREELSRLAEAKARTMKKKTPILDAQPVSKGG